MHSDERERFLRECAKQLAEEEKEVSRMRLIDADALLKEFDPDGELIDPMAIRMKIVTAPTAYDVLDEKEMNEPISIPECRKLREAIHTLTMAPILTKREYIRIMVIINQVCNRLDEEGEVKDVL